MISALLGGAAPKEAYLRAIRMTKAYYEQTPYSGERAQFTRIFSGELPSLPAIAPLSAAVVTTGSAQRRQGSSDRAEEDVELCLYLLR